MPRRFLVIDEGWSITQNEEATRFLQENWKLARRRGVANVAVCHRVTDLGAQADSGTAISKIGEGLLDDAQTQIVFRTSPHVLDATTRRARAHSRPRPRRSPACRRAARSGRCEAAPPSCSTSARTTRQTFTDTDARLSG